MEAISIHLTTPLLLSSFPCQQQGGGQKKYANTMKDILQEHCCAHQGLYLVFIAAVLYIYRKVPGIPSWAIFLVCFSRRIHSIFVLRCALVRCRASVQWPWARLVQIPGFPPWWFSKVRVNGPSLNGTTESAQIRNERRKSGIIILCGFARQMLGGIPIPCWNIPGSSRKSGIKHEGFSFFFF